jgi:hypothetical protein
LHASKGHIVNQLFYLQVLRHFHNAVHHEQLQTWEAVRYQIYYDSFPAHLAQPVQIFLDKHNISQARQPLYSSYMATYNF